MNRNFGSCNGGIGRGLREALVAEQGASGDAPYVLYGAYALDAKKIGDPLFPRTTSLVKPLELTAKERAALVAFLETL